LLILVRAILSLFFLVILGTCKLSYYECFVADLAIQIWFDRSLERDCYGIDPDSMPRVVTSRSLSNLSSGAVHVRTKRDIKLEALQLALTALNVPDHDQALDRVVQERSALLRRMLKT